MMLKYFKKITLISFMGALLITPTHAIDLGIKPSDVFALWTNVNNALGAVVQIKSPEDKDAITAMKAEVFSEKTPGDVLDKLTEFRHKFDTLRQQDSLGTIENIRSQSGKVLPSDVYLNSGNVLDGVVEWLGKASNGKVMVSTFQKRHSFSGKTPSDVFGLVDLANRRMDIILQ